MLHSSLAYTAADHSTTAGDLTFYPSGDSEIARFPDGHIPRLVGLHTRANDDLQNEAYFDLKLNTWAEGESIKVPPVTGYQVGVAW